MIDLSREHVLTPAEAAKRCGVHVRTVRDWYTNGSLRVGRLGPGKRAKVITSIEALNEFQSDLPAAPAPSPTKQPPAGDVESWRAAMKKKHRV